MKTFIVLLRGVMPVGKNKVPMAELREVLTNAGFQNVRTYIQSGNALVDTELTAKEVETQVRNLIKVHIGPDLPTLARTHEELQKVIEDNPFTKGFDISRVFFVLLSETPDKDKVNLLTKQDFGEEKLVIKDKTAYLYIPGTYGKGTLSNNFLEKRLGISATMRNFNTISKLIALSKNQ